MVTGRQFPYVESLEHIVNCRTHRSCSVAGFALDDGLQAFLSVDNPGGFFGVAVGGRDWCVYHKQLTGDTEFQWRMGDVTLTQVVPSAKWSSIPNPDIQVKRQHTFREQGRHDIATSLVLNHKPAQARMQLTGMIHGGPDRAFKAVLLHDSLLGKELTTRAKLWHPVVHSISLNVRERRGAVLAAKSRLFQGLKVKAAFDYEEDQALVSITHQSSVKDGKRT